MRTYGHGFCSMTGWKQGYVVAAPELTRAVRMSHQFITFCGQPPLQEAAAFGISLPDSYYEKFLSDYARKRDWLCESLADCSAFGGCNSGIDWRYWDGAQWTAR